MHHTPLTPFGRGPATLARLTTPRPGVPARPDTCAAAPLDKWTLLGRLRAARTAFALGDRDLAVLTALLSFRPSRDLADGEPLVVFPSNASLADRAHGMAESTLRRHLARLVTSGVIARRDSPNGKRYARRNRDGSLDQAFGFDLSPLVDLAPCIEAEALAAEDAATALDAARTRVVLLLRDVTKLAALRPDDGAADADDVLQTVRQSLRRRLPLPLLDTLALRLRAAFDRLMGALSGPGSSGDDSRNERHHQRTESGIPVVEAEKDAGTDRDVGLGRRSPVEEYEPGGAVIRSAGRMGEGGQGGRIDPAPVLLGQVLRACPTLATYAPDGVRNWSDLGRLADRVAPWLGIDGPTWRLARERLGASAAAITLGAMMERLDAIRNVGGYLRALVRRHEQGRFVPLSMLAPLPSRRVAQS